ncbi:hypothetical protein [Ideonella sp.]|uniref:hypothetical protein n=1 Tax=Ideonella sp. TaxID=1929293 RepID=UPI0035B02D99
MALRERMTQAAREPSVSTLADVVGRFGELVARFLLDCLQEKSTSCHRQRALARCMT